MTKVVKMERAKLEDLGELGQLVSMQLRLPTAMRDALARDAKANYRSLNGEILWRLHKSLGEGRGE